MADPRFEKINELFINYSLGNFDYKIELSPHLDEIDAFISNINMLGEELKATTISKNYFYSIFNSVSDIIFIMHPSGKLLDLNHAGFTLLKYREQEQKMINLFDLFHVKREKDWYKKQLENTGKIINMPVKLKDNTGKVIECMISANLIDNDENKSGMYQGIIKDISKEKETENLVIRTIVDTQEKERERFARDLHDSLGQQLSGIRFFLGTLKNSEKISKKKQLYILEQSEEAVSAATNELRNICFNLMPRTLEDFGLKYAVQELCKKIEQGKNLIFTTIIDTDFPPLLKPLEIAIFRIIQEFINNSLKHGNAKHIIIKMQIENKHLQITLQDNGIGFDKKQLTKFTGIGLRNVESRVRSYNGDVEIESSPQKGTSYFISIPI